MSYWSLMKVYESHINYHEITLLQIPGCWAMSILPCLGPSFVLNLCQHQTECSTELKTFRINTDLHSRWIPTGMCSLSKVIYLHSDRSLNLTKWNVLKSAKLFVISIYTFTALVLLYEKWLSSNCNVSMEKYKKVHFSVATYPYQCRSFCCCHAWLLTSQYPTTSQNITYKLFWHSVAPPHAVKASLAHWGMDTGPLGVSCGVWHHNSSSRSFGSCGLWGGASMDLFQHILWILNWIKIGRVSGPYPEFIVCLLGGGIAIPAIRKCHWHEELYLACSGF